MKEIKCNVLIIKNEDFISKEQAQSSNHWGLKDTFGAFEKADLVFHENKNGNTRLIKDRFNLAKWILQC